MNYPIKNGQKNKHLPKEGIYMSNNIQKSLPSFVIRKLQNKTIMRCHYTPIKMLKITIKLTVLNAIEDAEQQVLLFIAGENTK